MYNIYMCVCVFMHACMYIYACMYVYVYMRPTNGVMYRSKLNLNSPNMGTALALIIQVWTRIQPDYY